MWCNKSIKAGSGSGKKQSFTDLGSGIGIPCIIASLFYDFEACVGIEIVQELNKIGMANLLKYDKIVKREIGGVNEPPRVQLYYGDFLNSTIYDWSFSSSLVFVNSTMFEQILIEDIYQIARHLSVGSRIILLTTPFINKECLFKIIYQDRNRFSWGFATIFIYERVTNVDAQKARKERIDNDEYSLSTINE